MHLQCSYVPSSDPGLKVEWTHDGKPIAESSRLKTVSDFGFVMLDIAGADTRDSGLYECTISNRWEIMGTDAILFHVLRRFLASLGSAVTRLGPRWSSAAATASSTSPSRRTHSTRRPRSRPR